jgi:hypothetical protein
MNPSRKAELKRTYKETPIRKGIFKIVCESTGQTWVDASTSLDSIQNRIWFTLRMGSHRNRDLQGAWNAAGADAMRFEIVEVFPEDVSGFGLENLTKDRKKHWMEALDATPCL